MERKREREREREKERERKRERERARARERAREEHQVVRARARESIWTPWRASAASTTAARSGGHWQSRRGPGRTAGRAAWGRPRGPRP